MKRFGLYCSLFLIAIMALGPLYSIKEALSSGKLPETVTRLHYNTGNATRLEFKGWSGTQDFSSGMAYGDKKTDAVIVVDAEFWQPALAAQSFSAPPLNYPVLLYDGKNDTEKKIVEKIQSWSPRGVIKLDGTSVLLAGKAAALENTLRQQNIKTLTVPNQDPVESAAELTKVLISLQNSKVTNFLVAGAHSIMHALPSATWLAHSGTPLVFVERDGVPEFSRRLLNQAGNKNFYILGPESQVGKGVFDELGRLGRVYRIGEENVYANAVAFARYYNGPNRFGWQATADTAEAARHILIGSLKDDWRLFLAGTQLFSGSNFGPLLFSAPDRLPAETEKFLWSTAPDWWVTPAEGPFNHVYILGGLQQVSYAVQGRIDFIQEIRSYLDQGDQGISGIDALAIVWFALSLAAAAWTWFHLSTRLTQVAPFMKISWVLVMLVLGPVGLWAYYTCYRGYDHQVSLGEFPRPLWVKVLSATLGTVGFGMATMVALAFLLAFWGLPLFVTWGFFFWLGSPMTLSIILSYLAALLVNMFVFVPLMLRAKESSSYVDTVRDNVLTVFISMTSISVGMMGAMWLIQMRGLSVMPEEETITWWATVWAANLTGLVTGYVGNWWLVVRGRKIGTM